MTASPPGPGSAASGPAPAAPKPPLEAALKWIAAVGTILAVIAASFQVTRLVSDVNERKRFIAESLDVSARQQAGGDYPAAWTTLDAGIKSADEGGQFAKLFSQLSTERRNLRQAQEELAMVWLRNVSAPAGRKFGDVVDRLLPVLDRGAAATQGIARADRIAHVGWGYYLKLRDGPGTLDPPAQYKLALAADGDNPFAHAFWGHWMLWRRESIGEAMAHFDRAAANPATQAYVRSLALAGLSSRTDDAAQAQFVRLVDRMWRNGETLSARVRKDAFNIYHSAAQSGALPGDLAAAIAPEEHVALIEELAGHADVDTWQSNALRAARALFEEKGGDTAAALATWRGMRANMAANESPTLRARADAAIRRLQMLKPAR